MKIYFAGSIRGGRDDKELYASIIEMLGAYGTVLTEHIGDAALTGMGEQEQTDTYIFERDMDWVRASDVIVAEVTTPSLGVGYEIGQAQALGKKVLCLYRAQEGKRLSAMISGNSYPSLHLYEGIETVPEILHTYFSHIQ
ncbi:nucleoside 2-deoxyribosyltransferase [Patescibacteria group bacterium]|nr:nucleoside 2-deoxyribosyltransferase [Patescibacteria group bacterium]